MILTRHNVIMYLIGRGLLSVDDVVSEEIEVRDEFRRNRNFSVRRGTAGGFFVKQSQGLDEWGQRHSTLRREADCYELARGNSHLEQVLPAFHDFSDTSHVLVVGLVDGAQSMFELGRNELPAEASTMVGRHLATCHAELGKMVRFLDRDPRFPAEVPWILRPATWERVVSDDQGAAQAHLVEAIHAAPGLCARLDELADGWQINGIIHGDMKWDNCLVAADPEAGGSAARAVRIVDWELADAGDVAWDVAGMLQGYLARWIGSMDVLAADSVEELAASASVPLDALRAQMQAFWETYVGEMDLPAPATPALRRRSAAYAAARLLQTAYEDAEDRTQLNAKAVLLVQLSANMLSDLDAAEQLLGLR